MTVIWPKLSCPLVVYQVVAGHVDTSSRQRRQRQQDAHVDKQHWLFPGQCVTSCQRSTSAAQSQKSSMYLECISRSLRCQSCLSRLLNQRPSTPRCLACNFGRDYHNFQDARTRAGNRRRGRFVGRAWRKATQYEGTPARSVLNVSTAGRIIISASARSKRGGKPLS